MEKYQKAVSPSVTRRPDANTGWLSIAPRLSHCKCSCASLANNFNMVMLHADQFWCFQLVEAVPLSLTGLHMREAAWLRACQLRSHGNTVFLRRLLHGCTRSKCSLHYGSSAANSSWPDQTKTDLGRSTSDVITSPDCTADLSSQRDSNCYQCGDMQS